MFYDNQLLLSFKIFQPLTTFKISLIYPNMVLTNDKHQKWLRFGQNLDDGEGEGFRGLEQSETKDRKTNETAQLLWHNTGKPLQRNMNTMNSIISETAIISLQGRKISCELRFRLR